MGQCGCGETNIEKGFTLPSGVVVAYHVYRGCPDCFSGPGISVYIYPNKKSEWLQHAKLEPFTPDEYGGESGHGIPISFFEVKDLIASAKQIGGTEMSEDGYETVEDWLYDNGLEMMQDAMVRFRKRMAAIAKEIAGRRPVLP